MDISVKYYGASWCAPCKQAKPEVQRLCKNFSIILEEFNYDEMESFDSEKITKLPTVQIWQDGKQIQEYTKNHIAHLEEWLTLHVRVIPTDDF